MPDYNVFKLGLELSLDSPLFFLFSIDLYSLPLYFLMKTKRRSFYKMGLLKLFPPFSPTLINYNELQ